METNYEIHVISSIERKSLKITECTADEAMAFAIVLFQKYARENGDKIVITSFGKIKILSLNEKGMVDINA